MGGNADENECMDSETVVSEVRPTTLSEAALEELREAIVEGRLAPNTPIREVAIARQLGISRAPLREALRQLMREGLVLHVPYRGTIVTPLTARTIEELRSLRRLLEEYASERLIAIASDEAIASLAELVDTMEQHAATGDIAALNLSDLQFHQRLIELSDHQMLLTVWQTYMQQIRRILALRNRINHDPLSIVAMHRDLLHALLARDMDEVRRCYDAHGADFTSALRHFMSDNDTEDDDALITE
jgi:DNA-binding GntR family transcriptional regulator